jgi:signal transduction histidine kinase/HAMP domain-containing protein
LLAVSAALWTLRAVLARGGFPQAVLDLRVFDLDAFASRALPDLWRSPADFFLTGVALLGQAVALAAFLRDAPGAWRRRRGGAPARAASDLGPAARIAGAALLGAAGLLGFARLARHVVANSGLNLLDLRPAGLAPEVVLLQTGLLAVLLGGMLLVAAAGTPPGAGRGGAPPGRLGLPGGARLRYLVPPAAALGAVIAYPVLAGAYQDAVARFYEYDLMPRVLDHHRVQEVALVNSLAGLGREAGLPELLAQRPETDYDEVAFDCWSRSDLAQQGLNSSIELIDRSGQVLGRFSLNMPPGRRDLRSPDAPSGVEREILQSGDRITEALHASLPLVHRGRVVGVAVLHVLDSAENLPFLSSSDPYTQFFRRPGPPEETAAGTPVLYQYDPDGAPRGGGTAPQVPTLGGLERPGEWRRVASPSGEPMDLLFARGPDGLYALGHAAPDPLAWIGGLIRLVLLYVCIAVAAGLGAGLVGGLLRPSSLRLWALAESLGRSYYRKLFATFVAAALVPLLALAVFLQGFVAREIRQERVVKGSQALDAASRILTRVSAEAVETPIDDRVIDLIHNMVGRDLHLYVEDRLIATSRRELVTAGLLPAMLDGPTYRSVYLEGRLLSESPAVEAGAEVTLLASPVSLGGLGTRAVLGLHVLTRPGDVEAQVSKVSEAILIATALLVLLLAGTGYLGARLISSPILGMVSATRRLARGELDTRVQARTRDETASLARSFNEMAGALKEREGRLRSSLLYIQKILDNATTGVVSLDARGGVVTINPAAERLLAGGGALARGDDLGRFLAGCAALRELDLAYARARGSPESEGAAEVEVRGEKAGGARRLRAVFVPFPLEAGATGQIVLLEDVTDMVRSNRLSAWAEMARQIAHDVKNPLTPIQLAVGHLRRMHRRRARSERPEEATFAATLEECLDIILEQVRQLRWIATEFSSFARIPEIHREPTDPAELIASVLRPYADAPPERVRVEQRVEPGLPRVPLDPDLMRRTLVNLVENSLQAMPDGGRLSVSAGCTRRNGASYLEIAVSDTGVGVDPKSLERLFEPYFTTKGTGTGLGLAIARRAVEEHGGEIRAESQVGRGTTFRIWIPLGPDPPATEEPPG